MRRLELLITAQLAGTKVDTLLKKHLNLSGTVVRRIKWLEDGILVDGARVNPRFCPAEGQILSVQVSDPERRSGILPAPGPLDIVYEDEDLIDVMTTEKDCQRVRDCKKLPDNLKQRMFYTPIKTAFLSEEDREVFISILTGFLK